MILECQWDRSRDKDMIYYEAAAHTWRLLDDEQLPYLLKGYVNRNRFIKKHLHRQHSAKRFFAKPGSLWMKMATKRMTILPWEGFCMDRSILYRIQYCHFSFNYYKYICYICDIKWLVFIFFEIFTRIIPGYFKLWTGYENLLTWAMAYLYLRMPNKGIEVKSHIGNSNMFKTPQ